MDTGGIACIAKDHAGSSLISIVHVYRWSTTLTNTEHASDSSGRYLFGHACHILVSTGVHSPLVPCGGCQGCQLNAGIPRHEGPYYIFRIDTTEPCIVLTQDFVDMLSVTAVRLVVTLERSIQDLRRRQDVLVPEPLPHQLQRNRETMEQLRVICDKKICQPLARWKPRRNS